MATKSTSRKAINDALKAAVARATTMGGTVLANSDTHLAVVFKDNPDEIWVYQIDNAKMYSHVPGRSVAKLERMDQEVSVFHNMAAKLV